MRLVRVLAVLAALALVGAAAASAQDSTATGARASRTPHRTLNKEDCLSCHRQGNTQRVTPVPAEHDYPNTRCMRCHRSAATMPSRSQHAFDAPHQRCVQCHVAGNTEHAQPIPGSHSRYTGAQCVMCHEPQAPG